jgi:APA family basic amino acid/polyamine antiporter
MARDGLFFQSVGKLSARTGAPVTAILLQGVIAAVIALLGAYEQILNYDVSVDFIAFALTAASLFIFRARGSKSEPALYRAPGHPYTTALFVLACAAIVASTWAAAPLNSLAASAIMLSGLPAYWWWRRR